MKKHLVPVSPQKERLPAPPVYNPSAAVQRKSAVRTMAVEHRPAPPVYRPALGKTPLQRKETISGSALEKRPAPPVFKPTQNPQIHVQRASATLVQGLRPNGRAVQAKGQVGALALEKRPAPPVYRAKSQKVPAQRSGLLGQPMKPLASFSEVLVKPFAYRSGPAEMQRKEAAAIKHQAPTGYPSDCHVPRPRFAFTLAPSQQQTPVLLPGSRHSVLGPIQRFVTLPGRMAVVQREEMQELINDLKKQGEYKRDRNYMVWKGGPTSLPHVGWKAHVPATAETAREIASMASKFLREKEVGHKFDIDDDVFQGSQKFITVYADDDDKFQEIIPKLEQMLSFAGIKRQIPIEGDMAVGKKGFVGMRHGQNTPLMWDEIKQSSITIKLAGKLEKNKHTYRKWTGENITYNGKWSQLWSDNNGAGPFFFTDNNGPPNALNPSTVAMAILYNGKIVPDLRNEPNPANAPLPSGVKEWELPIIEPGSPDDGPSPLKLAMEEEDIFDYI